MTKKINILHLTYDMGIGGTEQVILQLIKHTDESVFNNSVVCIEGKIGAIGEKLKTTGTEFHLFNRQPGFDINLIKSVRQILVKNEIDIVHCHQYTPYVYGVLAALTCKSKVVFTEHGRFYPDRYSWKRRVINPFLGLTTHAIVAISAATKDALAEYEWFAKKSIQVIYNGIQAASPVSAEEKKSALGLSSENTVFGTITRFDPIKNLPMMIEAFSQVYRDNNHARLLMVGDGEERQQLEQLVAQLGIQDAVIFTGFQTDTATYMSLIDVYVLSSFSEGTSMTLLEAMSMSTCCVVTNVGGNVEIITDQSDGFIVESDDVPALSDTMKLLLNDSDLQYRTGNLAKDTFDQKFDLNQMIQRYRQTYLQVLGQDK